MIYTTICATSGNTQKHAGQKHAVRNFMLAMATFVMLAAFSYTIEHQREAAEDIVEIDYN